MNRTPFFRLVGALLFAWGFVLHVYEVPRPIDASSHFAWRESDLGMIARNFWRGDLNILYPQIDWRKDGPGYVESELPVLSWLMAATYRVIGYHEVVGRGIAVLTALGSLLAFRAIARRLLPPGPAAVAVLLFWLNPLLVRASTAIQPDPGMLLAVLLAVLALLRWREGGRPHDAIAAGAAIGFAILLKAPAACVGLLFAAVVLERHGWRAVLQPAVWLMAALAILPSLAWYVHAHHLWTLYGNSLGLTNECHWLDADLLRDPRTLAHMLVSLVQIEVEYVYVCFGAGLAAIGVLRLTRATRPIGYWLIGIYCFYVLALRTAGDAWAIYYHALSVPPACLLMALGVPSKSLPPLPRLLRPPFPRLIATLQAICLALTVAAFTYFSTHRVDFRPPHIGEGEQMHARFAAARAFQSHIPHDTLVVTLSDNHTVDEFGKPIAHDDSPMLFWLDRRGFTLATEEHTLEKLTEFRVRGARFAIYRDDFPIAETLTRTFPEVSVCGPWRLIRL